MKVSSELQSAIDGLYEVFSRYPLPEFTDPCLHCHTLEDEAKLHAKPLRELGEENLRDYMCDALSTWGDVDTFKHLLPRLFELYVSTPNANYKLIDPEIMFNKLRYGKWRTWSSEEQAAVECFLYAVWKQILDDPPLELQIDDMEAWLCTIAQCEDDLDPYLNKWIEDNRVSANLALSSLLLTSAVVQAQDRGRNAFWETRDEQYAQLKHWARSEAVAKKLLTAEIECNDPELASEFAAARAICDPESEESQR
jgi:hypothetical protein